MSYTIEIKLEDKGKNPKTYTVGSDTVLRVLNEKYSLERGDALVHFDRIRGQRARTVTSRNVLDRLVDSIKRENFRTVEEFDPTELDPDTFETNEYQAPLSSRLHLAYNMEQGIDPRVLEPETYLSPGLECLVGYTDVTNDVNINGGGSNVDFDRQYCK